VTIERLSAEDRMLLLSDRVWPQDVGVLVLLEGGGLRGDGGHSPIEVTRAAVARGLERLPRLRQVLRVPPRGLGGPFWVDAPDFDLARHVRVGPQVDTSDEATLLDAVEEIRSRRLDLNRPLWEIWLLPGPDAGVTAVFVRMHHVVADGVAGVASLSALLRDPPGDGDRGEPARVPVPEPSGRELLADAVCRHVRGTSRAVATLRHPGQRLRTVVAGWRATRDLVSGEPGPATSLGGLVGPHRRLALVRAPLAGLEETAHAEGATVNDLLLASIAGGVRALLTSRGEPVDHLTVPILVPVSLRRRTDSPGLGNRISQMRVGLPVGEPEPDERLRRITAATSRAKAMGHPSLEWAFGNPVVSAIMLRLVIRQRINLLSADIIGPTQPLSLAGAPVRDAFPLVNLLGNVTLGVGALSHAGRFDVLVVADADLYPDLDVFAAAAADELRRLSATSAKDLRP
jgi:WS/DGAT/MGAT family acyltransferase